MIVCDRLFECEGWEKSYRQLNDAIIFCHFHSAGPKYTGVKFKYCPWCGKEITPRMWEERSVS